MNEKEIVEYYNHIANTRDKWRKRNRLYHKTIEKYIRFSVPVGSKIIEIGCGTGDLLASTKPSYGVGVDISEKMLEIAKNKYPNYKFILGDAHSFILNEKFDYIILSDLLSGVLDVQQCIKNISKCAISSTRIIITSYNYLWEPILKFGTLLGIKQKQPLQNWLSVKDIENILFIEDFEKIKVEKKLLVPKYLPIFNLIFNKFLSNLPILQNLNLIHFIIARPFENKRNDYSVSIIIPARNEKGNIENVILQTPRFGKSQEFIFVEGNSKDGTLNEMYRVKEKYANKNIKVFKQKGVGKGDAVRLGFAKATGDVLMILDSDLTTPPGDLPKFYEALATSKGEFINGCRLVYPMEKQAMRFLNLIGNKFFGNFFSFLLGQRLKDTLCGTKVLFRNDYERIVKNRTYFGEFDPFGDFDLLFGASKLNLKITEIIVRYKERKYGSTQIKRIQHGWLLIKMSLFAARKIKFN